jgi:ABC-type transport system involved in multi-copper enzyme maturation permease subunit
MKLLAKFTQNPIIRQSLRNRRLNWRFWTVLGLALLAYCPTCLIGSAYVANDVVHQAGNYPNLDDLSRTVFYATAVLLFILVFIYAPMISTGAIVGERQRQTLDLLLITLLPARSIVVGKLVSALIYILLLLALTWPIMLFALITDGTDLVQLAGFLLLLAVTSVTFTTIGLFMSSLGRTITNAILFTFGLILPVFFIVPPLLMLVVTLILGYFLDLDYGVMRAINFYGWGLVLSLNPLGAAIYSARFYLDGDGILVISSPYYLVSPWFMNIVIYILITWYLVRLTIRRLERIGA